MRSSAARACAWRPASNFFQRSNARAMRAATCGLSASSAMHLIGEEGVAAAVGGVEAHVVAAQKPPISA